MEQVKLEGTAGNWDTFESTEKMNEQKIGVTMMCSPDMRAMSVFAGQCNPGLTSTFSCVTSGKGVCKREIEFDEPCISEEIYLQVGVSASERPGKKFELSVRVGAFDPSYVTGNGMTSYSGVESADGTFTLKLAGFVDTTLITNMPAGMSGDGAREQVEKFLSTAEATSAVVGSRITVYPAQKLKYRDPADLTKCRVMPIRGMWADSNGGQYSAGSLVIPDSKSGVIASMKYISRGPHYGLPDANGVRGLNLARFKVFIPNAMITAAGYADASEFPDSAVSVKTADGQTPSPTRTTESNGLVFDLGITHFSAPDPTVDISSRQVAVTTTTVAVTATTTTAAANMPPIARGRSLTSSRLATLAGLARPSGSKVTVKVSAAGARYCRVVGTSVKGLKAGTCKVTVTVKPVRGATKSKTLAVTVS